MEIPNSNAAVKDQFRKDFLNLLETLRFSIVVLHNELHRIDNPTAAKIKPIEGEVNTSLVAELLEGKDSFVTRIENFKHDVDYQQNMDVAEMKILIERFQTLKTDIITVLQAKVSEQNQNHPQKLFSPAKNLNLAMVLKQAIERINQNWIEIKDKQLQIHTLKIPEEIKANQLSSGMHLRGTKGS
jgi:hypothetical protein